MKKVNTITLLKEFLPYIRGTSIRLKFFLLSEASNERPHWFNDKIRINSFFPPYPSQSFDRIVDIIKNQKRIPHTIDFAVTSKCPFNCPHCSYGKRKMEDLNTNEILKVIQEIKDLGTAILGISGGEPMTRADLGKIVSACYPELFTILYTTGFNFNKKIAQELYDSNLGSIFIGIDSADPKIQDDVRGKKGSLELGIKAINICNETGIYTGINTIATRERINNGELERIYNLACSLEVKELEINFPIATGRWTGCANNQLNSKEIEMLKEIRKNLTKKRKGPIVSTLAEYESADFMGCIAGYQCLFIDSSGEVCPCDFTPLSFGNIKQTPLKEIWKQMQDYFPRPRTYCLMSKIANEINSDFLPLPPEKSKAVIPNLEKESPNPKIYKYTKKNKKINNI